MCFNYTYHLRQFLVILTAFAVFTFCTQTEPVNHEESTVNEYKIAVNEGETDLLWQRACEIVSGLSDRHLTAQILMTGVDGMGRLTADMRLLLKEIPAGGIMLFRFNLTVDNNTIRSFTNDIRTLVYEEVTIPPFIAVDHEGGTVFRFRRDVAYLPNASVYYELFKNEGRLAALEKIEADSLSAGLEIKNLGFTMNFAPIAEYLIDENYEFLQYRSYGPDPVFTAQAVLAYHRGMKNAGILCVIKHFPGSAGFDPHFASSELSMNKGHLNFMVSPFSVLINNGARGMMAAHTGVPAVDNRIASLSPVVMQNWLREELGFDGLIISDDFNMAAAGRMRPEEAAIQSIIAGSNMVMVWAADLRRTHRAFLTALNNGRLPRERLVEAATQVVYEKLRMELMD